MAESTLPRTRWQAIKLGLTHFYTGKPCKNGHIAVRYVKNGGCQECNNNTSHRWAQQNIEKRRAIQLSYANKRNHREQELVAGRPKPEVCDICGRKDFIVFNHDPATNTFRGWICHDCNLCLGHVNASVEILRKMIEYLQKPTGPKLSRWLKTRYSASDKNRIRKRKEGG